MVIILALLLLSFFASCCATPTELGIRFDKRTGHLPTLTLPYGTWRAQKYTADIYLFKNIRFGAPPVGNLRWAKPSPPLKETATNNGSYGPICIQSSLPLSLVQLPPDPSRDNAASVPPPLVGDSEDCLFLDVYVPAKAIENRLTGLPVISWFYGGGFIQGGKDIYTPVTPFYDGRGPIEASGGNVIFVTSNYRLGVYGFLAGTTMEKEGLPNAGLYDQRAVLQWIQDYIGLLGGDKSQVSAWGESAGATSILQHLTAFGGTQDPLFSRAILESPASPFSFDRKGNLEKAFRTFATRAGCDGKGVACLRAASANALQAAYKQGNYAFFPSADGKYVRQAAILELASGNYWKHLDSIIISHVLDEPSNLVPNDVKTDQDFKNYVSGIIPPYAATAGFKSRILARYPPALDGRGTFATERQRLETFFRDLVFSTNIRALTDAYAGKNFNLQYSASPYTHGADVFATFYFRGFDYNLLNITSFSNEFGNFATTLQSYLVSHAQTGDPNKYRKSHKGFEAIRWPRPDSRGDFVKRVLNATDTGFKVITDEQVTRSIALFWEEIVKDLTELGGYTPPARKKGGRRKGHY